ncbi:hypothetical protein ACFYM0_03665 [Streptomyces sp. NPDC006487]|uniref:hypothetical protein n=1 Tax=Streptomyces sp. NPDC006487 TaxID=3364748 RepID=UPI003691F367
MAELTNRRPAGTDQPNVLAARRSMEMRAGDGALLTELIDGFETEAGMQPAGDAFGGLIRGFFRFGPMQDRFIGRSTNARITVTTGLVTWDAFEQPHRTSRDCAAVGRFHFDRHPYDDALRALRALSAVIGAADDDARA